jgi:hypothetical protein
VPSSPRATPPGWFRYPTTAVAIHVSQDWETKLHLQRKPYAGVFYITGLLQYWRALCKCERDGVAVADPTDKAVYLQRAMAMFDTVDRQIRDPSLCGRPAVPDTGGSSLANVMCMAAIALDFLAFLPEGDEALAASTRDGYLTLIREAMQVLLWQDRRCCCGRIGGAAVAG